MGGVALAERGVVDERGGERESAGDWGRRERVPGGGARR